MSVFPTQLDVALALDVWNVGAGIVDATRRNPRVAIAKQPTNPALTRRGYLGVADHSQGRYLASVWLEVMV
jgi:hypothetical protein